MATDRERGLDRLRKLLNLSAGNDNAAEAERACEAANEMARQLQPRYVIPAQTRASVIRGAQFRRPSEPFIVERFSILSEAQRTQPNSLAAGCFVFQLADCFLLVETSKVRLA